MRKDDDWSKLVPASEQDKHPDLAKQRIMEKYPGYTMVDIDISDNSPMPPRWDAKVNPVPVKSRNRKESQRLDLDRTWRKELAR